MLSGGGKCCDVGGGDMVRTCLEPGLVLTHTNQQLAPCLYPPEKGRWGPPDCQCSNPPTITEQSPPPQSVWEESEQRNGTWCAPARVLVADTGIPIRY